MKSFDFQSRRVTLRSNFTLTHTVTLAPHSPPGGGAVRCSESEAQTRHGGGMAPPPEEVLKAGRGQRGACVSGSAVVAGRGCDTVAAAVKKS